MIQNIPKWAIYAGGAVALYLVYRAVTDPEKLGASIGGGAVSAAGGVVKGVGAGVKGAIDGAVQGITGDDSATLGTGIYDAVQWIKGKFGMQTDADMLKTPPYVPKSPGASSLSDWLELRQAGSPVNEGGTFAEGAGMMAGTMGGSLGNNWRFGE